MNFVVVAELPKCLCAIERRKLRNYDETLNEDLCSVVGTTGNTEEAAPEPLLFSYVKQNRLVNYDKL